MTTTGNQKLSDNQKGLVFGLLASLAFAGYVLINRYVYINYKVDEFRYVVTFLAAGGVFATFSLLVSYWRKEFSIKKKNNLLVVLNGLLAGTGIGLYVFGQGFTTAVNATILATFTVITTILYSKLILNQTLSRTQQLWILIMFAGLYLAIVGHKALHLNKGDIIILISSVILGFTNVLSKILMKDHSSKFIADVRLLSGGLLFLTAGLIIKGSGVLITSAGLWPLLAGLCFWLTIKFFYAAVHYVSPNKAIVLANSHPIFTPIAAVFILGEPYTWSKFIGSALILLSVYFINSKNSRRRIGLKSATKFL
ncbi:MAG TPA: DMT family transporter [Candidatus Saccharimonadales bacterium]|nr:DMT family transporter [Candidatus Saccharimonadales bacterium]